MIRDMLSAAAGYLRKNPDDALRLALNAGRLRFGVPIAALSYFATQVKGRKAPKDIEVGTAPPALRVSATVDMMGTVLRAAGSVRVDDVEISTETLRVTMRVNDIKLKVLDESETPVATLVKSGALDLSKPGNLVKFIPKRHAAIVDAEGDRIVIDLMKVPAIGENLRIRRVLEVLSPLVGIRAIETDGDHLYVALRATPGGLPAAVDALRNLTR